MIAFPPGGVRGIGVDLHVAVYPDGTRVRYLARIRPPFSVRTIVERVLADDPGFEATAVGPLEELETAEGELGVLVRVAGRRDGRPAARAIGAVLTDELATAIDVVGDAALARQLVVGDTLALGVRPRRFRYEPPPGWQALPSGLVASWYPLDFPAHHAVIVVPPATPIDSAASDAVAPILSRAGAGLVGADVHVEALRVGAAEGRRARATGTRDGEVVWREVVAFAAPPYLYALRLEVRGVAGVDEDRQRFQGLLASVRLLPARGSPSVGLAHWIE